MRHFTTLIDASTLFEQLSRDDLVVFDCRFDLGNVHWGENGYASAHLPGALYLHLDRDLSGPITPSSGRHPLPTRRISQGCSVSVESVEVELIAYDQGSGAHAAACGGSHAGSEFAASRCSMVVSPLGAWQACRSKPPCARRDRRTFQ